MNDVLEPVNFLLVDDLEENLLSLEALLRRDGLVFCKARTGEEALELLLQHDFALALLDVQMPGMDGFELAEFMRGTERTRHIPIIFLTAGAASWQRRFRGYEAGAVDYIQKPIEPDVLKSKSGVFLELARQRRQIQNQRDALQVSTRALADAADQLEDQVRQRTAELEDALTRLRAETAEREQVEASLRQSQKMEAVGQLTGGIAHDFNNMLTGIIGSIDLVQRRIAVGRLDDVDRLMDAASASALRAAALTHRLLAFSRRQSLDPKPVDVGELIRSMSDLLERAINATITLSVVLPAGLPAAMIDPHQLENAILNLALNARDAMPDGGVLAVETSVVELDESQSASQSGSLRGLYLVVAVSDTGTGMLPEVVSRVFEPFFTTKPQGQGTGLGLSMVYGFARQSGGTVRIQSEVGVGTSVKLILPTTEAHAEDQAELAPDVHQGSGEHVLVVEDDPAVRLVVREVLQELAYHVLEFADPLEALPVIRSKARIDLMIFDVILPSTNGRELAQLARIERPGVPTLFITGYVEDAFIVADFLGNNMALITKPFSLRELASTAGRMLAASVKSDDKSHRQPVTRQ